MTEVRIPAPAAVRGPDPGTTNAREREVFLPRDARRRTLLRTLRERLRWPLGIYTTPVAILIAWEVLARAGAVSKTYAPAPTSIVKSAADLWQQGVLGPDVAISLQRAGIGLAIGLTAGIVTGVLGGLLRSGEYLFNGLVQVLNTIPSWPCFR
ncbi:ABC transporter permease [Streptomyces lasalocidi]